MIATKLGIAAVAGLCVMAVMPQMSASQEIVLQQGLNGYAGCVDADVRDPGSNVSRDGGQTLSHMTMAGGT